MKLKGEDADDSLIGVFPCTEQDDILLASYAGKCVRFPVADVRTFQTRSSTGVRGMKLGEGDRVISMSVLRHIEVNPEEREAYFSYESAQDRIRAGENGVEMTADNYSNRSHG